MIKELSNNIGISIKTKVSIKHKKGTYDGTCKNKPP